MANMTNMNRTMTTTTTTTTTLVPGPSAVPASAMDDLPSVHSRTRRDAPPLVIPPFRTRHADALSFVLVLVAL